MFSLGEGYLRLFGLTVACPHGSMRMTVWMGEGGKCFVSKCIDGQRVARWARAGLVWIATARGFAFFSCVCWPDIGRRYSYRPVPLCQVLVSVLQVYRACANGGVLAQGDLLFVWNFHTSQSYMGYKVLCPVPPAPAHLYVVGLSVRICAHAKLRTNIDEYQSIKYKYQGGLPVAGQVQDCAGFGLGRVWRTRTQRSPHHFLHRFLSHALHALAQTALAYASSVADWGVRGADVAGETGADGRPHSLMLYSPARTVMVLAKVHE